MRIQRVKGRTEAADIDPEDLAGLKGDSYLDQLAQEGLLEQGQNTAYIDVESTKIWLESNGKYTKEELADMSEMDIKMANIGSNVFIAVDASLLDAMEDVTIAVNI